MKIVAIMGEAGTGKDTIAKSIIKQYPDKFNEIISCTTRPPRQGEQNGINYYFISENQFADKQINGDFLEWDCFNNWYYGTDKEKLSKDKINIGVFTPNGIRKLLANQDTEVYSFYIRTSDKQRLLRQINREDNPDISEIIRRFSADKKDFNDLSDLHYIELKNEIEIDLGICIDAIGTKEFN